MLWNRFKLQGRLPTFTGTFKPQLIYLEQIIILIRVQLER